MVEAYVGIDVACAKKKFLPINMSVLRSGKLVPLPLRNHSGLKPPAGSGNVKTLEPVWLEDFAEATVRYLRSLECYFRVKIFRIAIDAPSDPKRAGATRRRAEEALDRNGIRCFTTPSVCEFDAIRKKVHGHLASGGEECRMPHANQLWMLVGFALFQRLRKDWECLEVYPQATVAMLSVAGVHKSNPEGIAAQLRAASEYTGWPTEPNPNPESLRKTGYGKLHDSLDAYLSAWVASREPFS